LQYGMEHLPASKEYAPDLVDEVDGIAQGAGVAFEKAFFLNCFDEVSSYNPDLVNKAVHGCTAFGATGRATREGTTYVGQGWDMDEWYVPYLFRLLRPDGEPEALVLGHPSIIGGTGINSHGLAMVWNSLKPTDTRVGAPCTFVLRKALQQQSLGELVGAIINCPRANGMNFIAGASYGVVDVEVTATKYSVTYGTIVHHANHYEAPELKLYEEYLPNAVPDTLVRTARMRQLLDERYGAIDLPACQEIMRDHGNYPGSICRHCIPGRTNPWQTQSALIYVPAEGKVLASNGRPCETPFVEYTLTPAREMAAV